LSQHSHDAVQQAIREADDGLFACRICKVLGPLDQALTVWRNGVPVYGFCDSCAASHHILIRPTERGIEVKGKRLDAIVLSGS